MQLLKIMFTVRMLVLQYSADTFSANMLGRESRLTGKPAFWMYAGDWLELCDMWLWSRILSEYGGPRSKHTSTSNLINCPTTQSLSLSFKYSSTYLFGNMSCAIIRYHKSRVVVVQINNQWRPDKDHQDTFSQSFLQFFPISVHLLLRQL